jgi:hypothetical protein
MKNIGFIILLLFIGIKSFSQQQNSATESIYNLKLKGELGITSLPVEVDPDISINAQLKVIRNSRFCILIIIESSIDNPVFSTISNSENEGDTLLFDVLQKRVYSFSERKSYWYSENTVNDENVISDTIKKADTVIVLSKTLKKEISPTPTLKKMKNGILNYSTKSFTFQYVSSKTTTISLEAIYKRTKGFVYTKQKTEFAY